jgi:hypothetical protein
VVGPHHKDLPAGLENRDPRFHRLAGEPQVAGQASS